jgi:hypothetical protein
MGRSIPVRLTALLVPVALSAVWAVHTRAAPPDAAPTIAKDSIRITFQTGRVRGGFEKPGWVPALAFRVNGPIASGSTLSAEFTLPGKSPWVTFDCPTEETAADASLKVEGGGESVSNEKAVEYTGVMNFAIKLRNPLSGTNVTLFTGKAKVSKTPTPRGAGANYHATSSEYYVEDDWRLPIGYVFWEKDNGHNNESFLHVLFWYRGNPAQVEAHLFYNGKDIAKCKVAGNGPSDWNPKKAQWSFADCQFLGVYLTPPEDDAGYDPKFALAKNPGDYEVKVLLVGNLARSIKFKVDSSGKFDTGIAEANRLGSNRAIVPVQVIGSQETWDHAAWKTDAFYGNPLTGFTVGP